MKPLFADSQEARPTLSADGGRDLRKTSPSEAKLLTQNKIDDLGVKAGERVARLSQRILSEVRASDIDQFGERLNELIVTAKDLDPAALQKRGILSRVTSMFKASKERLLAQFDSVEKRIGTLIIELESNANRQKRDIAELEQMYADNYETFRQFEHAKKLGEESLEAYRAALALPQSSDDAFGAQHTMDLRRCASALEQKIDDLSRAMLMSEQLAPQIRLEQDHKRTLISKFGTAKTVLIPAWTNAFSLYIKQLSTKKAADLANATFDAADAALRAQADQLHANAGAVAALGQRPVIATDTFAYTQ